MNDFLKNESLNAYRLCDNSVCMGLYNAPSLRIFFRCFLHLPSVCIRIYFIFFKMCQKIITRTLHSSSYNFRSISQSLQPWLLCASIEQSVPSQILLKSRFLVKRKPFFCLLSLSQVPIHVRNVRSVHTDFRRHSFKLKNTE